MITRSLSRPATVVAHQIYISRGLSNVYVPLVIQNLADYRETESSILQVLYQKKRWANEASRSPVPRNANTRNLGTPRAERSKDAILRIHLMPAQPNSHSVCVIRRLPKDAFDVFMTSKSVLSPTSN
jgi:hypothetical protein